MLSLYTKYRYYLVTFIFLIISAMFSFFFIDTYLAQYIIEDPNLNQIYKNQDVFLQILDTLGKTKIVLTVLVFVLVLNGILKFILRNQVFWSVLKSVVDLYLYLAIRFFTSVLFGYFVTGFLKVMVGRARPYTIQNGIAPNTLNPFNGLEVGAESLKAYASFPSGHATTAFALATVIYVGKKEYGIIAYVVASLVCWQRIITLSHYPSDVLIGSCVGTMTALVATTILTKYQDKYSLLKNPML